MKSFDIKIVAIAVIVVFIAALAVLFLQNPSPAASANPVVHVAYLPSYHSLPLFIALEKGYFEEAGFSVEVSRIETPKDIIDGLVSGRIDAGPQSVAAGIVTVVEAQNPSALKVYSLACESKGSLSSEVLVPVDSPVQSIADLRGKKIGHIPGVQWQSMTKMTLIKNGIDPSEVSLVELPFSSQLPALASHSIDALFTLEPTGSIGERSNAAKILVVSPFTEHVVDPWCGGAGVLSAKFATRDPVTAQKFVAVMNRAGAEADNPAYRQYLVKYLDLPQSAAESVQLPEFIPVQSADARVVQGYQSFADVFFELGVTTQKIDVVDLFLNQP